jgi:hypothetical protein
MGQGSSAALYQVGCPNRQPCMPFQEAFDEEVARQIVYKPEFAQKIVNYVQYGK